MDNDFINSNSRGSGCDYKTLAQVHNEIYLQPAWRAQADREADYFDGNQLDSQLLQELKKRGIPPAKENLIGRTVRDILGIEAKNRTDWKVLPDSEIAGDEVATALNVKLNKAERESGADKACTLAHAGQVKVGIGWVEVSRETNPFLYPYKCRFIHRNEIWWDMLSREPDLSDCRWLLRRRWVQKDVPIAMFPHKKELIQNAGSGWELMPLAGIEIEGGQSTDLLQALDIERGWSIEEQEWRDQENGKVCMFELLTRKWVSKLFIRHPDGRVIEYDKTNPLHVAACACGFEVFSATVSEAWKTFFLGPHKLHDEKLTIRRGRFPYVPFFGEREDRTGVPYGTIRDLMYLQDEVNARISKMQWGLASVRVERTENVLAMSDEAMRQMIARPDADIKLRREEIEKGGFFKVERDFQLNREQYNRLEDLRGSFNKVSGVTEAFQGEGGNQTASGLTAQIEQTVQSLATIEDNFRYARTMVGELLLEMIIEDTQEKEEVEVPGSLVQEARVIVLNSAEHDPDTGIEYRNNDVQRARLKVTLADVPTTPSFRQQQLSAMSEAFKSAPPQFQTVMMPYLMSLMDVPHREEIVEAIKRVGESPTPDQIEEQTKQAVQDALAKSGHDLRSREIDLKEARNNAEIEKIANEAVNKAIESMYAAMQAAGVIAQTPETAKLADTLLRSGGFVDKDAAPLVPEPVGYEQAPQVPANTNPTTPKPPEEAAPQDTGAGDTASASAPPPAQVSAFQGERSGIETPEIEGNY